ncbi:MAG: hypothetical protein ABSH42_17500 [Bryobacteraceae bacterium]|jgi:hypothetical protein
MICILLVSFCFVLNAGGAAWILVQAEFGFPRKMVFAAVAAVSIALKLILAAQGHNYDLVSYGIVASLVRAGQNVYAHTTRYNYAPLWACFLAGLQQISDRLPFGGPEKFHLTIAGFLAVTDVTLAALLATAYSYGAGLFFLCSPVIVLLTGYHTQFDGLALLFGLVSWLLIRRGTVTPPRIALAGLLGGISLGLKHVLFLFPLWVLFWPGLGRLRRRFGYAAMAYGFFAASFLPWATDPTSRAGIVRNVFEYRSERLLSATHLFIPGHVLAPASRGESTLLVLVWLAALIGAGLVVARRGKGELLPMYLLVMFGCSPALVDQYLAIPMPACAILFTSWPAAAVTGTATLALLMSPANFRQVPPNLLYFAFMAATQICSMALFIAEIKTPALLRKNQLPALGAAMRAGALSFGAAAFALLRLFLDP